MLGDMSIAGVGRVGAAGTSDTKLLCVIGVEPRSGVVPRERVVFRLRVGGGQPVTARRTVPGRPLHVRVHFVGDDKLCGCTTVEAVLVP